MTTRDKNIKLSCHKAKSLPATKTLFMFLSRVNLIPATKTRDTDKNMFLSRDRATRDKNICIYIHSVCRACSSVTDGYTTRALSVALAECPIHPSD